MTSESRSYCNITILSQHFYPSSGATAQLITDLARGLAFKGHNLKVVTSTPSTDHSSVDINTIRSPFSRLDTVNILSKALDGVTFVVWSAIYLLQHSRRTDILLVVSNPPFIGIVALIVRFFRGVRYIFLLQDLFPRSAELTGVLPVGGPVSNLWTLLIQAICQYSSQTIVLSDSMRSRCLKIFELKPSKVTVIHNWAVETALPLRKEDNPLACDWKVQDLFTVQYSGNFGRLHEIITLLETARILAAEPFHFLFVGGGAKSRQISAYVQHYNLKNVSLYPYQERSVLPYSLAACDISAIGLIPGSEDTVAPSKFYGIISSGKPVLLLARHNTDIAELIVHNKCGVVLDPGDPVGVADALRYLQCNSEIVKTFSENSIKTYQEKFGIDKSIETYHKLISHVDLLP